MEWEIPVKFSNDRWASSNYDNIQQWKKDNQSIETAWTEWESSSMYYYGDRDWKVDPEFYLGYADWNEWNKETLNTK